MLNHGQPKNLEGVIANLLAQPFKYAPGASEFDPRPRLRRLLRQYCRKGGSRRPTAHQSLSSRSGPRAAYSTTATTRHLGGSRRHSPSAHRRSLPGARYWPCDRNFTGTMSPSTGLCHACTTLEVRDMLAAAAPVRQNCAIGTTPPPEECRHRFRDRCPHQAVIDAIAGIARRAAAFVRYLVYEG